MAEATRASRARATPDTMIWDAGPSSRSDTEDGNAEGGKTWGDDHGPTRLTTGKSPRGGRAGSQELESQWRLPFVLLPDELSLS